MVTVVGQGLRTNKRDANTPGLEDRVVPSVHRNGDSNTGGGVVSSSRNVNVNGQPISVDGDSVSAHPVGHIGVKTANGSGSVKANGKPVNRQGDADTCAHTRSSGSSNVFAG